MKNKIAHILNLISMALRDNDFDEQEKKTIIRIASRLGVSSKDLENQLKEENVEIDIPDSLAERIEHLHDLVLVMLADGIIHEEEIKFISKFINAYGFVDTFTGNPIMIDVQNIKNQISFKKFIEEYRKTTAEELSSIVVDRDFNIKYPLYNTVLHNIGPLPKTLYVFFLIQKNPLSIVDLSSPENKRILGNIYSMMPGSDYSVEEKINNLTNPDGLNFNSNRSILKKSIISAIPSDNQDLINYYSIYGGRNQKKEILLSKELIQIQPKI